jgi:class 3 adenylate cyclase
MIGKLTTNIIIHDYNERLLFIKNNMNLQSVNFVSNMLENIKKYNTNNPNMTEYCNNYIKHIKSNFMSVIPENNDSLRKELLKKILPLGFDDTYMQSSTNIIKKIASFSSTDSNTDSNTVSNTDSKQYNMVCILFTDIVNYTDLAKKYDDKIIFQLLNTVYNRFDNVIKKYTHLQKVETIGDAYMVVGDIYRSTENYKSVIKEIILLSFDLVKEIKNINTPDNKPLSIRVGINMGRVSVGILGNEIPRLCVVGNAVNVASRLQSTAEVDSIQISRHIYEQLEDIEFDMIFDIKTNENVFLKNIGSLTTYTISNVSNTNVLKEN